VVWIKMDYRGEWRALDAFDDDLDRFDARDGFDGVDDVAGPGFEWHTSV
jgi:hypothetical protein